MVEEQVLSRSQALGPDELQVEVISDTARFDAIGAEWDSLVERAGVERMFVSHTWVRTWWEAFGQGRQLHIITVRAGGELVAVAPLMRTRSGVYGLKVNSIESIYNPHTPRYDFIIAADDDQRVYRRIWHELAENSDCDMVLLAQVPEDSRTIPVVQKLAQDDGWLTGQWTPQPSPYIRLACTHAEFSRRLKGSFQYNLRKRYEKLGKLGPIDVEVITERSAVRDAMQDGLRIEAAAWKGDQGTAILSDPAVTEFYTRLAERQADLGQLRLTFLRVAGKRISFNYLLQSQQRLYGVKIGYDPGYHTYSPGNMLLNLILQHGCESSMDEYDFLGVDDKWKLDWTKDARRHQWLFLFKNRLRPRLLHYVKFSVIPRVKPGLKRACTYLPGLINLLHIDF
jgi:CelD/BcsL family acetyltransferase involved in cellulose biosynthesis